MSVDNVSETIVEYSISEEVLVDYPYRIVSPPHPSSCCVSGMDELGNVHYGEEGPYTYKRCRGCGYTVRLFPKFRPSPSP